MALDGAVRPTSALLSLNHRLPETVACSFSECTPKSCARKLLLPLCPSNKHLIAAHQNRRLKCFESVLDGGSGRGRSSLNDAILAQGASQLSEAGLPYHGRVVRLSPAIELRREAQNSCQTGDPRKAGALDVPSAYSLDDYAIQQFIDFFRL